MKTIFTAGLSALAPSAGWMPNIFPGRGDIPAIALLGVFTAFCFGLAWQMWKNEKNQKSDSH